MPEPLPPQRRDPATPLSADELEALVATHGPAWRLYAARGSRQPDDLVQEALLRLLRQSPPPDEPAAWVFRVLRNLVIDAARRVHRERETWHRLTHEREFVELAQHKQEECEAIQVALDQLDEEELLLVVGKTWGRLTFEQLGSILECSAPTALRRHRQVLERLASLLSAGSTSTSAHSSPLMPATNDPRSEKER